MSVENLAKDYLMVRRKFGISFITFLPFSSNHSTLTPLNCFTFPFSSPINSLVFIHHSLTSVLHDPPKHTTASSCEVDVFNVCGKFGQGLLNVVDFEGVHILYDIIRNLKSENRIVIISSHIIETLFHTCDKIAILQNGQIEKIYEKSEYELLKNFKF